MVFTGVLNEKSVEVYPELSGVTFKSQLQTSSGQYSKYNFVDHLKVFKEMSAVVSFSTVETLLKLLLLTTASSS